MPARDASGRFVKGSGLGGGGGSSGFRIVFDRDEITPRLNALPGAIEKALAVTMVYEASRTQSYARDNAPWNDQTGNARNGLFAESFADGSRQGIVLYHTVPYGIWLEVRFSGTYQIIQPTIQVMGAEVMKTVSKLLARIK